MSNGSTPIVVCVVSGPVMRVDGSPVRYGTVTFNSTVPQTVNSQIVQPSIVSAATDSNGNLAEVALAVGVFVQITVSDSGITYPPMTGWIPNQPSATFSQILAL